MLLEFETISSCWTWYSTGFFCSFKLIEQWDSPCYRTLKHIKLLDLVWYWYFFSFIVTKLSELPWYYNLKQYQVAGLGMVMLSFLFVTKLWRVAVLLEFESISSCWTWYGTDISFPFFLPNYQSRGTIRTSNNIKLLDLIWYWYFFSFFVTKQSESRYYWNFKQNQFAGLDTVLIIPFLFCHQTIRVAVLLELQTISICWTWYGTDISFPLLSPNHQSHRVIRIWNNIKLLDLVC